MANTRAALEYETAFRRAQMDRVRKNRLIPQYPMRIINIRITLTPRKQFLHQRNLIYILTDMRLHKRPMLLRNLPNRTQTLARTTRRKSWSNYRPHNLPMRINTPDILNRRHRIPYTLLRALIAIIFGRKIAIHAHSSHQRALAFLQAYVCEEIGSWDVYSCIVRASRRSVAKCSGYEIRVNPLRARQVRETRFHGKRIRLQPIEQRSLSEKAGVGVLRRVIVCVDEAGEEEAGGGEGDGAGVGPCCVILRVLEEFDGGGGGDGGFLDEGYQAVGVDADGGGGTDFEGGEGCGVHEGAEVDCGGYGG